ncbi:TRAP transporter small permease [Jiella sp. M17.18]|uniref:TRAP transporter small permease n=1 Tax=Jiella sp. M17.18 TaxID=3234247 RepID=UPI0034DEC3E5
MLRLIRSLSRAVSLVLAVLAGLTMAAIFGIIFVNSLQRYLFGTSFQWGEKLPIYLTIYGVMFGTALGYLQDRHVRFTVITDLIPARVRHVLYLIVDLVMVAAGVMLAWSGWLFAESRGRVDASSIREAARGLATTTGIDGLAIFGKLYPYQLALAIGGALVAVAALVKFAERLLEPVGAEPQAGAEISEGMGF